MPTFSPANQMLARVAIAKLYRMHCLLSCSGELVETGDVEITTDDTVIRVVEPDAIWTIVTNSGVESLLISESGVLVSVCAPGASIRLPVCGYGEITASLTGAEPAVASVKTYRRCECGTPSYTPLDVTPIGHWLL